MRLNLSYKGLWGWDVFMLKDLRGEQLLSIMYMVGGEGYSVLLPLLICLLHVPAS